MQVVTLLALCATLLVAQPRKPAPAKPAATPSGPPLRLERSIPLPGIQGRLGRLAADPATHRVFVPATNSGSVEVVNLQTGQRLHSIKGIGRPVAAAYHPKSNRLFVSARQDSAVLIFDGSTYRPEGRVELPGGDPDTLRISPATGHVFVAYGNGAIAVLTPDGRKQSEIRFDSHPEDFSVSSRDTRIFANLPLSRSVAVADRSLLRVLRTWPVTSAAMSGSNYALAIDEANRRIFVGLRRPSRLLTLSSDSGVRVDDRGTVEDPESIFYDAAVRRLYITGKDAAIDVVAQLSADKYEPVARIPVSGEARSSLLIPETARFCVAVPASGGRAAELHVFAVAK